MDEWFVGCLIEIVVVVIKVKGMDGFEESSIITYMPKLCHNWEQIQFDFSQMGFIVVIEYGTQSN